MGKRKSKARVITMKKPVLAKKFKCPFCCTPDSCEVAFQKLDGTARIECRVCAEKFECTVTSLAEPVDVYASWIDACEATAKEGADGSAAAGILDDL